MTPQQRTAMQLALDALDCGAMPHPEHESLTACAIEELRKALNLSAEHIPGNASTDAIDARRWRAIRTRHAVALCRIATDGDSYSSLRSPMLLDAWADFAAAELETKPEGLKWPE